jgi:hypothetical protein
MKKKRDLKARATVSLLQLFAKMGLVRQSLCYNFSAIIFDEKLARSLILQNFPATY